MVMNFKVLSEGVTTDRGNKQIAHALSHFQAVKKKNLQPNEDGRMKMAALEVE